MFLTNHRILRRSLYCCLALLSMSSVMAPSLASAKRQHRVTARTKRVIPKAPWKKAWNKYARTESGYASVYLYPVSKQLSAKRWYSHINKRTDFANKKYAGTVAGWNRFFADHQHNKGAFSNDIITYPAYKQISDAGFNANHEKKNQNWLVDVPYSDTVGMAAGGHRNPAVEADYKRALMVANLPMKDLTPHQTSVLTNWAEPVHNNQRLLTSFHNWMKANGNAPRINVSNRNRSIMYTYNNKRNFFTPTVGNNGRGITYIYNPKVGHYQKVSNVYVANNLTDRRQALAQMISNYLKGVQRADANNPILDQTSKRIVAHFASQPGTSQAEAYRKAVQFCATSQGRQLIYSANRAEEANRESKTISTEKDLDNVNDLLSLQSTPMLAKLPASENAAVGRYLLAHPVLLHYMVRKYHTNLNGVAEPNNADATKTANEANNYAAKFSKSQRDNIPTGIISSNANVLRQMSMLHQEVQMIAKQEGLIDKNISHDSLQS